MILFIVDVATVMIEYVFNIILEYSYLLIVRVDGND